MKATWLWPLWQAIVLSMALGFTRRGKQRFVQWVTGLALNVEEHTITQSLVGLDRADDWKALESFAEYGSWNLPFLQWGVARRLDSLAQPTLARLPAWAATTPRSTATARRSGAPAPSTSTPPAAPTVPPPSAPTTGSSSALCCPTRANPPTSCLSPGGCTSARRNSPLPRKGRPCPSAPSANCWSNWAESIKRLAPARPWAFSTAASPCGASFGRCWSSQEPGQPRIDFLTRLRQDARLHALPVKERKKGQRGPTPVWGKRLPPPRQGGRWPGAWQEGTAFIYGRQREVVYKEVLCLWRVLGHDVVVKAVVACVEGYKKRFTLVSSATDLTGLQVVEIFCAVQARGRLPRPEAKAGVGGVPCLDAQPDREGDAGGAGDADGVAAVAAGVARRAGGRLVAAPAVEQGQGEAQRAGCGKAASATPRRIAARSGFLAGQRGECRRLRTAIDCYVTETRSLCWPETRLPTRDAHAPSHAVDDSLVSSADDLKKGVTRLPLCASSSRLARTGAS